MNQKSHYDYENNLEIDSMKIFDYYLPWNNIEHIKR